MTSARWVICLLLAIAGCTAPSELPPTPTPIGELIALANAPQTDPPALAARGAEAWAFWVGVDERGVHHDGRRITPAGGRDPRTLPLPPRTPHAQSAIAVPEGVLLFWLDARADSPDGFAVHTALLDPDLNVLRAPDAIGEVQAFEYAAMPDGSGGAWLVWSGGAPSEPTLTLTPIDRAGRPLASQPVRRAGAAVSGRSPALTWDASGRRWLFWLARGEVWRGQLAADGMLSDVGALTTGVHLAAGDRLLDLRAGSDGTFGIVVWHIERADGERAAWVSVGAFNDPFWSQPRPLRLGADTATYAVPLDQPAYPLPIAVLVSGQGTIVTLRDGVIGAPVAVHPSITPLRPPHLSAGADALWLAWAQPGEVSAGLWVLRLPR